MFQQEDVPVVNHSLVFEDEEDEKRAIRMTHRKNRKMFMVYPEDRIKGSWDLFITLVLLFTCIMTPLDIAFSKAGESNLLSDITDLFFLIDIIIIFNSAYYDDDMDIIDHRGKICVSYLSGWFLIDFMAIVPFELILKSMQFNSLVRVSRFGRLYKIVKITRLVRILKIMKEKNKLLRYLNEFLKLGLGFERLFFFIMIFLLSLHIVTCLWLICASMNAPDKILDDHPEG